MTASTQPHIVIIGAGAAGVFAAINIAEKNPHYQVTLLEAGAKPLQKVFISGGGRCNVTHACFDPKLLIQYYPRGAKELQSVFSRFQPKDMIAWLEKRGLRLHKEADGRMFPVTDESQSVIDLFVKQMQRLGIILQTRQRVRSIQKANGRFEVHLEDGLIQADKLVMATGYSPPGWQLVAGLGHRILTPVPSLFPFKVVHPLLKDLQGISVLETAGRLIATSSADSKKQQFEASGPVLITHTGLSGPVIYRLSALGARALAESQYQAKLILDWLPGISEADLKTNLQRLFYKTEAVKKIQNIKLDAALSTRLWHSILLEAGVDLEAQAAHLSKKQFNKLIEILKRSDLPVTGKSPSKEEFVSCGGVDLKEVDFKTMESKICPGLYFAGEILNIDGLTGGFNFQSAWSTAWTLASAI